MTIRFGSTTRALAVLGVATLVASACKKNDEAAARNESAAGGLAPAADTTTKPVAANGWTDESILAYLRAQNTDEIKVSELAAKKAKTPAVRTFATKMLSDHRAGLKEVQAMMTKAHSTADTATDKAHDVQDKQRDELKDLSEKASGVDWDKDYINMQIDEHKAVLDKLNDAAKATTNTELQAMIVKASGTVQEHLTKAEAIKATFK